MVTSVSNFNFAMLSQKQAPSAPASSTSASAPAQTDSTSKSGSTTSSYSSKELQRSNEVVRSQSNAKATLETASTANKKVEDGLAKIKDVATKLADDKVTGDDRKKLQEEYKSLRKSLNDTVDKASYKADGKEVNLLKGDSVSASTNTKGGQQDIKGTDLSKGLALPDNLDSADAAKKFLSAKSDEKGSLASAEKNVKDTASQLQSATDKLAKSQDTTNAVNRALKSLEQERTGSAGVSSDESTESKRQQALELARQGSEQIRSQLTGGLSGANNSKGAQSLLSLLG